MVACTDHDCQEEPFLHTSDSVPSLGQPCLVSLGFSPWSNKAGRGRTRGRSEQLPQPWP